MKKPFFYIALETLTINSRIRGVAWQALLLPGYLHVALVPPGGAPAVLDQPVVLATRVLCPVPDQHHGVAAPVTAAIEHSSFVGAPPFGINTHIHWSLDIKYF